MQIRAEARIALTLMNGRGILCPAMNKTIFHVDLDAFFASIEQRDNPALKGKPVIVGAAPGHRGVVSTCSYEARAFGLHSAMPISEAYRRCPQGIYLPVRMRRYCEVSATIMEVLRNFTPDFVQVSVDEAFLDMTGTEKLWGKPEAAVATIKRKVAEAENLTLSVGVASNAYVAKIASGLRKPDGSTIVVPGDEAAFMRALPLAKLWGAGGKTQEKLRGLGIRNIAELQAVGASLLGSAFGKASGLFLSEAAWGRDPGMFSRDPGARSLSGERTFECDTSDRESIESVLRLLADELAARLWNESVESRTLVLKLRFGDFSTITRRKTRPVPYSGSDDAWTDARSLLDANWDGSTPIRLVGLGFADLGAGLPEQGELFADGSEKARNAERAVFELERKGKGRVRRARFIDPSAAPDPD